MTVAELVAVLQTMPQNKEVRVFDAPATEYREAIQVEQEPHWITIDIN